MSTPNRVRSSGHWFHLGLWAFLLTIVALPLMIPGTPGPVEARKCAKGYSCPKKKYVKYTKRCVHHCDGTRSAIFSCIGSAQKLAIKNCRADFKSCNGDPSCKGGAKSRLHLCIKSARAEGGNDRQESSAKRCKGCCRHTNGQGSCHSYFSSSPFYGSYRYHGKLYCVRGYGGGSGPCAQNCEAAFQQTVTSCGRNPKCQGEANSTRLHCLSQCPASPSGAFVPHVADAIRRQIARAAPWLVDGSHY